MKNTSTRLQYNIDYDYQSQKQVQQSSDTVWAQQIPVVAKRLSLSETSVQNLVTARAKSLLHTSKQ